MTEPAPSDRAPSGLAIGQGIDLLRGLGGEDPFRAWGLARPPREPLVVDCPAPAAGTGWQGVEAVVCDGPAALLQALLPCRVAPLRAALGAPETAPATLHDAPPPWGPALAERLGVPVASGHCYLLLRLRRDDGRVEHEVTARRPRRYFDRRHHLAPDWRKASSRLRPGRRLHEGSHHDAAVTAAEAAAYLDAFAVYGTHFVSTLEMGETLFQAALLAPGAAATARAFRDDLAAGGIVADETARLFSAFLAPDAAQAVGPVGSLAADPALDAGRAAGLWTDPASVAGESLFAAFDAGSAAARSLGTFSRQAPTGLELMPLARFLEFYRAISFERILTGALLERWGRRVRTPLPYPPAAERARADGGSEIVLDLSRYAGALPADAPRLVDTILGAPRTELAPMLRVPEGTLLPICRKMHGAVVLEDADGRQEAVLDGLRFRAAPAGRIEVAGDLTSPPAGTDPGVVPGLRAALARAIADAIAAEDADARARVAATAEWLAAVAENAGAEGVGLGQVASRVARFARRAPPALSTWSGGPARVAVYAGGGEALHAACDRVLRSYLSAAEAAEAARAAAETRALEERLRAAAGLARPLAPFADATDATAMATRDIIRAAAAGTATRPVGDVPCGVQVFAALEATLHTVADAGIEAPLPTLAESVAALRTALAGAANATRVEALVAAWERFAATRDRVLALRREGERQALARRLLGDDWPGGTEPAAVRARHRALRAALRALGAIKVEREYA